MDQVLSATQLWCGNLHSLTSDCAVVHWVTEDGIKTQKCAQTTFVRYYYQSDVIEYPLKSVSGLHSLVAICRTAGED